MIILGHNFFLFFFAIDILCNSDRVLQQAKCPRDINLEVIILNASSSGTAV